MRILRFIVVILLDLFLLYGGAYYLFISEPIFIGAGNPSLMTRLLGFFCILLSVVSAYFLMKRGNKLKDSNKTLEPPSWNGKFDWSGFFASGFSGNLWDFKEEILRIWKGEKKNKKVIITKILSERDTNPGNADEIVILPGLEMGTIGDVVALEGYQLTNKRKESKLGSYITGRRI